MTVKTGTAWAGLFVTLDATGAKATPSVGPAGVLYVDGVADAASVTISGSNPYKWAVTLPSLTAGQRVDMYITATIATIATAGVVASEQADTALVSEVKTDTAAILLDTGTDGVVLKAAGLDTDAVTKIQTGLATPTNITAGTITTATSVTNGVTLADDAITAAKFDESTAFPVKSADTGATAIARVGADSDTLETLSDQLDAVKTDTAATLLDTGTDGVALTAAAVDAILDEVVVGTYTLRQLVKVSAAALAGKLSGGGTTTLTIRGIDDASNVIVATVDASGNRSAVTVTV